MSIYSPKVVSAHGAPADLEYLFPGDSELAGLLRRFDWSTTPLGSPVLWPQSLKTCVRIMLTSRQPIWIGWGEKLTYLYNDPYKSIIGGKHPWALGRPVAEVWNEIWADIEPMLATAMSGGQGTYVERQLLIMERNGYREETYYTFSYSPIPNDDGSAGGIICANTDDTQSVISTRRLSVLREMAASSAEGRSFEQACAKVMHALGRDHRDLPFALLYLAEPGSTELELAGTSGIESGHRAAPPVQPLSGPGDWPAADAIQQQTLVIAADLERRFGPLPADAWGEPPRAAALVPVAISGETGRVGVLIVGLSPFLAFDDSYRSFLHLVAGQIASALSNAEAYQAERLRAEKLAALDRAKTQFFSNVSHEFRTPLTLMLSPLEQILEAGKDEPIERDKIELVHRNGLRLLRLVNTLLDFSRFEAGRARARFAACELDRLTRSIAASFATATERAGIDLDIDCAPLPEQVYVDGEMWEKIVLNLISNAYKFTFEGGITVRLEACEKRRAAILTVADTGVGIPADQLPHVFDRFHRISGQRSRSYEGTGIGLALVRELAQAHGGTVSVESTPGAGSEFTVTIPLGSAHLPPADVDDTAAMPSGPLHSSAYVEEAMQSLIGSDTVSSDAANDPAAPALLDGDDEGRGLVLLVDDNPDMREYIRGLIASRFDVVTATDGLEALDAIDRRLPDLVLTDTMMPRMDGFALLADLRSRERTRTLPVVMISARAGEEAKVGGLEAGADDYLTKPFSARELVARIEGNLRLGRLRKRSTEALRRREEQLRGIFNSSAVGVAALTLQGRYTEVNDAFCAITGYPREELLSTDCLTLTHPEDSPLMAAQLEALRTEQMPTVTVEKRYVRKDGRSIWVQNSVSVTRDATGAPTNFVILSQDITARKQAEDRQKLLLEELNHRVKNTLAIVRSIASQTLRATPEPAQFTTQFSARLMSLARAHNLLTRESWQGADLADIVEVALAPYRDAGTNQRIDVAGPRVRIVANGAVTLTLMLHELATNAAKYGALSRPGGHIGVSWTREEPDGGAPARLGLAWAERGGPPVAAPRRKGFGSRLLEASAEQLGADVELSYSEPGFALAMSMPLVELSIVAGEKDAALVLP